jgi:hypothetical protein
MADYRLYCFDGAGKVWAADWIKAGSDEDAVQAARGLDTGVKCEVWQGRRFVAAIELPTPVNRTTARQPPETRAEGA